MTNEALYAEVAGILILGCCAFGLGLIQQEMKDDNDRD